MSFSSRVKEELSWQLSPARHCQIAEIAAIISLCGRIQISENDRYRIKISTENAAVARKYFTLLKKAFNISTDVSIRQGAEGHRLRTYTVGVSRHEDAMRVLQGLILAFGLDAKIVQRKKYYVVYIKEGSQIVDILNVMEAPVSLMELENIRILKEMRGSVNRQVNCETANINKTVSAAVKQMKDITFIRDKIGFDKLPENLSEIAQLRLLKPEATLKELGEALDPPVGKSGVNHRLRKLGELAQKLREQYPGNEA